MHKHVQKSSFATLSSTQEYSNMLLNIWVKKEISSPCIHVKFLQLICPDTYYDKHKRFSGDVTICL